MPPYPGFVGGSYVAQSQSAANERTINWYVERQEVQTGKSQDVLYPAPGYTTLATNTATGGRAHAYHWSGREFAVQGTAFVEISQAGTITSRGTVAVDQYPATICSNGDGGNQVFITSGNNGYIFNTTTNAFSKVRTGATRQGEYIDGFFLALDADTGIVYISDEDDGTTWDPTQFIQRSIRPDPWIAMKVWDRYIRLFGSQTSEVWYNAGTSPIPFQAHPSGLSEHGIAAPFSACVVSGTLMWLSASTNGRGDVVQGAGFTPDVVSTFPLQVALNAYPDLTSAVGDTYDDLGHTFYLLTFPLSGTWCYDATPNMQLPNAMRWTERLTWISEDATYVPCRAMYHAFAYGQHRMLDRETGAIYRMTSDVCVDIESRPLRRVRRPPVLWAREHALGVSEFEAQLEQGLGLASGQGSRPLVALSVSCDGGKTFGTERTRSAGALGRYDNRTFWTRCGSVKKGGGWQPEIVVSDPTPWRLTGARFRARGEAA